MQICLKKNIIAAGHGDAWSHLIFREHQHFPILFPFEEASKRNIPMWVTEISDITPLGCFHGGWAARAARRHKSVHYLVVGSTTHQDQ